MVLRDATLFRLVNVYRRFERMRCLNEFRSSTIQQAYYILYNKVYIILYKLFYERRKMKELILLRPVI
jgi:hypothetical protein